MKQRLILVKINSDYCDFLRTFDKRVPYNYDKKSNRPFVGVLFRVDTYHYFAPLSSPKPKHKTMKATIDFLKIKDGELGAVNFNNMIPVRENNYAIVNLNKPAFNESEQKYQKMLIEQLDWLNAHYRQIKSKSFKLYNLYINDKLPKNIKIRCCNFKLLEEKCKEYIP